MERFRTSQGHSKSVREAEVQVGGCERQVGQMVRAGSQ
jgi:hypothetical protein